MLATVPAVPAGVTIHGTLCSSDSDTPIDRAEFDSAGHAYLYAPSVGKWRILLSLRKEERQVDLRHAVSVSVATTEFADVIEIDAQLLGRFATGSAELK